VTIGRPSRSAGWKLGVVLLVVVAAAILVSRTGAQVPPSTTVSTQPSSWELPRLDGPGSVKLADLHGRPTVVDFFASWCEACKGELPGMATVSTALRGKVNFVAVASQENGDALAMARTYKVDWWPLARDVGGTQASGLHDALGARGMPLTAFYDGSGKVLTVVFGAISEADLRSRIQALYGITA
jgi:thiol-disulfide isomerase/thioredoxin